MNTPAARAPRIPDHFNIMLHPPRPGDDEWGVSLVRNRWVSNSASVPDLLSRSFCPVEEVADLVVVLLRGIDPALLDQASLPF